MERTQIGGSRIPVILLILIISMSLSACAAGNDPENRLPDKHSGSGSANTQTVTDLTVEDVPALVPDVLKLREKKYEDIPFLETQEQLSEYALWNLLYGRTEFECRLSWDLSYDVSSVALEQACEGAMSYYLFSSYKAWDMHTGDDGNPDSLYGKVKLVYDAPEFDLEARLGAWSYVVNNPPPEGGFSDYDEEREYARKTHDYSYSTETEFFVADWYMVYTKSYMVYLPEGYDGLIFTATTVADNYVDCVKQKQQEDTMVERYIMDGNPTAPYNYLYFGVCA